MATVEADLKNGVRVDITNGRHTWSADEPLDLDGTDEGPNPYELLLGSLAACTCITLKFYADRKGIKLESVSARFHYEKIHADDCAHCEEDATGFLDSVRTEIFIEGDFTEDERKRMGEIAQRCPVHRTLERGIVFDENVVVG